MAEIAHPEVGAPVLDAYAPVVGTAAAAFHDWLLAHRPVLSELLDRSVTRWRLAGVFVEVNFVHPVVGPAGSIVLHTWRGDTRRFARRVDRLSVIPFVELRPYLRSWTEGRSVVVHIDDMPEPLARRYASTPIRWSANFPLHVGGTWVGLVGAVATQRGFSVAALRGLDALASVFMAEYRAYEAWSRFLVTPREQRRPLRLLP